MIEYNFVLRTGESEAGTMIFMIYKWIDNFKINRIQKPESVKIQQFASLHLGVSRAMPLPSGLLGGGRKGGGSVVRNFEMGKE